MTKTKIPTKSGTSTLVRARFGPGMLLQHDDLEHLNSYPRELSRLLFRSFFGCGVVCGLRVTAEEWCHKLRVTVDAGLALDCIGDPIHLPKNEQLVVGDECEDVVGPYWVLLCGTTKCCAPRTSLCGCDDDEPKSSCTREWSGYEIRVVNERPDCICGCPEPDEDEPSDYESECQCADPKSKCYEDHYKGICGCHCDDGSECDCSCVLLARIDRNGDDDNPWKVDHSVRRFIRPVLIRDPATIKEVKKSVPPLEPGRGGRRPVVGTLEGAPETPELPKTAAPKKKTMKHPH